MSRCATTTPSWWTSTPTGTSPDVRTKTAARYLNLVGDRYLDLVVDGPAPRIQQPPGSQIPVERDRAGTLDLLLGGLKPVIQGLNPRP